MEAGPRDAAGPQPPVFELASLGWERIQIVLRLHPLDAEPIEPHRFRLVRDDPPAEMAPTAGWVDGGDTVLRFNVMLGPGQMPLEPGRWALSVVVGDEPARTLSVRYGSIVDPLAGAARFPFRRGEYRVTASTAGLTPGFWLDIAVDRTPPRRSPVVRWLRRLLRPLRRARRWAFRTSFRVLRLVARRNGRRILFIPYDRRRLSGNLAAVHARMIERGLDRRSLLVLSRPRRPIFRKVVRLGELWLLARADVVVIDTWHRLLRRVPRLDAPIIQVWHATGAVKRVGLSRIGTRGGPGPWSRAHKIYAAAITTGPADIPIWAEAFGLPEERVVPTGYPRMDRLFDEAARAAGRETALRAFPAARGRTVILFAPTFRGPLAAPTYDPGALDLARLHALCAEKDAVLIVRLHPLLERSFDIPARFGDRLFDGTGLVRGEAPALIFAADVLVTDYSSLMFDFAMLGRPMLFFAPDLDEYQADRGLYVDYEAFVPGRVVRTFDEVIEAIRRDDYQVERLATFLARHFAHLDGRSTDRVVDLILSKRR